MPEGHHMSPEEIRRRYLEACARGINRTANVVMADAIEEAPLGPAESAPKGAPDGEGHEGGGGSGELRRSAHGPVNDESSRATPHHLTAEVSFNTEYAAAQHEGMAIHHDGTVWVVRQYTTPGTKKKYLEDPFKAEAQNLDRRIAEELRKEFGG